MGATDPSGEVLPLDIGIDGVPVQRLILARVNLLGLLRGDPLTGARIDCDRRHRIDISAVAGAVVHRVAGTGELRCRENGESLAVMAIRGMYGAHPETLGQRVTLRKLGVD